jgi:hypothetical protein
MAKKRFSSVDLSWMIFDRMRDEVGARRVIVAVVRDEGLGWRAVIERRRHLEAKAIKKLRSIETQLRSEYDLMPD